MSESNAEQAIAALATRLSATTINVASGYQFTPDITARVPGFGVECIDAAAGSNTIITLSPDAPDVVEGLTFGAMKAQVLVHVAAATRFVEAETDILHPAAVGREVLQDRLLQDIEMAVGTSNKLGLTAVLWAHVVDREKSPQRTFWPGWAIAFASVLIEYSYAEGAP